MCPEDAKIDSAVVWTIERSSFDSRQGHEFRLHYKTYRPSERRHHPPTQWVKNEFSDVSIPSCLASLPTCTDEQSV